MTKLFFSLIIFSTFAHADITIHSTESEKFCLAVLFAGGLSKTLKDAYSVLKSDLEFSGQLDVQQKNIEKLTKEKILKVGESCSLVLFLSYWKDHLEWRLYDGLSAKMIKGKKVAYPEKQSERDFVLHKVADQIFPLITSEKSSFASTIAACKKTKGKDGKSKTLIYSFYPGASKNKTVTVGDGITLSPHWHPTKPVLFYSQHTPLNVRLMMLEDGIKRVISTFDGLNITPAFSPDGKIAVSMTRNGVGRLCEYKFDRESKKGKFYSLTAPDIHAFAPSFIDDNSIVFCAIDWMKTPRVGLLSLKNKKIKYLSKGSCLSPTYSKPRNEVAYCKRTEDGRQIYSYSFKTCKEKQLTFDKGYKVDCCWSPCGNYLAFAEDMGNSRIAILNLATGQKRYLTPINEHWTSPAWSPVYEESFL